MMDQINETKGGPPLTADVRLCVAIYTDTDPTGFQTRRAFVERLRDDAPENFKAVTLAPISECVRGSFDRMRLNGKRAEILHASKEGPEGRWQAGIICGPLCGIGYFYAIDRTYGEPVAVRLHQYVN